MKTAAFKWSMATKRRKFFIVCAMAGRNIWDISLGLNSVDTSLGGLKRRKRPRETTVSSPSSTATATVLVNWTWARVDAYRVISTWETNWTINRDRER